MKITNICDNEHLTDCGLPDKIIPINNSSALELNNINTLSKFNQLLVKSQDIYGYKYEILDTKAGAFETVNGESILAYYNPDCQPDLGEISYGANTLLDSTNGNFSQPKMCANFVFDLNGKKGPNTVGKDIGVISVLYSTDPVVVSPNPYPTNSSNSISQDEIDAKCKELSSDAKVPTIDEMTSIFFNAKLFGITDINTYWSSTVFAPFNKKWLQSFSSGGRWQRDGSCSLRCVKR